MSAIKRKEVILSEVEAGKLIHDGMTVAIGGFINSLHPMAIIRQIIRNQLRNLTLVGSANAGLDVDLLIGAGCVKKVIATYVGAELLAPIGPMYRALAQAGEVETCECDEAIMYAGLRAEIQKLPFLPVRDEIGTSYPEINPGLKVFEDPIRGEKLIAVPPISPEIAILHAGYADCYGNVQHVGSTLNDEIIWMAADATIVEVEKIVSNEEIRRSPQSTKMYGVEGIVRAPYGAHPYASPGFYVEDGEHIKEYVAAGTAYLKTGDRGPFQAYLDRYVYEPETHLDYLERIGVTRLLSLHEY